MNRGNLKDDIFIDDEEKNNQFFALYRDWLSGYFHEKEALLKPGNDGNVKRTLKNILSINRVCLSASAQMFNSA